MKDMLRAFRVMALVVGTATAVIVFVWRFTFGSILFGGPRTNASFWRRGDSMLPDIPRASWYHFLPAALRGALRVAILAVTVGILWVIEPRLVLTPSLHVSYSVPAWLWWTTAVLTTIVAFISARYVYRSVRTWQHIRTYVEPLNVTLSAALGMDLRRASTWLTVPQSIVRPVPLVSLPERTSTWLRELPGVSRATALWSRRPTLPQWRTREDVTDVVVVKLPAAFVGTRETRLAVEHIITAKLGLVDMDSTFAMVGNPTVTLRKAPRPPAFVSFGSMAAEMEGCAPGQVVLGRNKRSEPFYGSFLIQDPHWLCSAGSGRGKSWMLQATAAQILRQDVRATLSAIDPKMDSLTPLVGIPGVRIANNPDDIDAMWAVISDFRAEVRRRMNVRAADPTAEFPIALLVVDELNQFSAMTSAHWRATKEKGDPSTPPVWHDLAAVLWQGRAFSCHVIVVGQRVDERSTGGIGLRDSFGFRALAGFTPQAWMMLVGTSPVPRSQKVKGRWIYSDGEAQTWVQNVYGTPAEIRDYALVGRRVIMDKSVSTLPHTSGPTRPYPAGTPEDARAHAHPGDAPTATRWVIGLNNGAAEVGMSVATFRRRRAKDGGCISGEQRKGNQPAWTVATLTDWANHKVGA